MKLELNVGVRDFARIQLAAITLVLLLGAGSYAFTLVTGYDSALGFLPLLDVGKELSLPTYFSALNLLLSSILLLIIYRFERSTGSGIARYWLFLALLLLLMSVDEAATIHENFGRIQQYLADRGLAPAMETHKWTPIGFLLSVLVAIGLIPFLKRLPRDAKLWFIAAGLVFLLGAVGFEWLGSWMLSSGFVETRLDPVFLLRRLAEEGLEMYGIGIFNIALYREIVKRDVSIVINPGLHQ